MNTRHSVVLPRFSLLLLVVFAQVSFAQGRGESTFLPEGIEATGDTVEIRALNVWAGDHRHSHPEQARQVAERALALARELDDQRGIGKSLSTLGSLAFASDLRQAEAYFTAAHEAYEQIGNKRGLIRSRQNIGTVYARRGDVQQALAAFLDTLEGLEYLGDTEGQTMILNNIGILHYEQGNLGEAQTYFERAIALAEKLDKPARLASSLRNFGVALADNGTYENAEVILRRALAISNEWELRRLEASISNSLGYLHNRKGHHEKALPFLFTAERLSNELGEDGPLGAVYDELGKAYMGLGRYDRALHYAHKSLALARESESITSQMEVHQTLSRIYEAAGNDGQALAHYRQYATVRDSVFNAEKTEIIAEMQTRYETEEKQRAIERLEQENQVQTLRQTLLLGGIVVALLIAGLFYNRYRIKQKAHRLLEELDTAKSRFFANISHEFRTPLTVVLGELQDGLAGRFGTLSEKLAKRDHVMLRNTRRLQRLIDEVLALNRLESGKLELKPFPGDLVRSLRRLVEADAPLAERNGINLTFEHDVEICPRLYDQEKLEKIVGNLLSNALKFTPRGGSVRVRLRCGKVVEISVTDDGPGIPIETQKKVFERFAQVEDGVLHGGTGIGLALAKELAELHGGTITLDSAPGEGSAFTVRLPLEKTTLDEIEAPLQQNIESLSSEEFSVGGDGHERRKDVKDVMVAQQTAEPDRTTVLVIEDNDDMRAYVRRSLEETYRVLEAAGGETGLQQARTEFPDLIVSDVMLPGIDGYEIARQLKAEVSTECIPVIMLTARAAEEDQAEGYGSGAEVYITKPFSPETLRAAVARLLEERRRLRRRLQEDEGSEEVPWNGQPTFVDRARTAILKHLHDEDFGVEELAAILNMTRHTLYNRFMSEAKISPSDFVRALRLERARELLSNGAGSVSEVAYAVGFNSLSVFSRNYRAHYGTPPSSHLGRESAKS